MHIDIRIYIGLYIIYIIYSDLYLSVQCYEWFLMYYVYNLHYISYIYMCKQTSYVFSIVFHVPVYINGALLMTCSIHRYLFKINSTIIHTFVLSL